jgi:lysyl-tRNA synthetase, class II
MTLVVIERHALGPRLRVLGRRVHEAHAGIVLGAAAVLCLLLHAAAAITGALGLVAAWLIAKDWRDLHPATRDTAGWSLGMHRCPGAPPPPPVTERVPGLAGLATAVVGAINVAAAMAGELPAHARALLALPLASEVQLAQSLALPGGLALLALAVPIARRRRRAVPLAVGLLAALGVMDLVRSRDVALAAMSWTLAVLLWRSRAAFAVEHEPIGAGQAWRRVGTGLLGAILVATASLEWLPDPFGIVGAAAIGLAAALLLAPLRPRAVGDALERHRAAVLVRRHGSDTLSAFKLRQDVGRLFSADGRAMVGYRVKAGALLIAGDPVGPPDALPGLMDEVLAYARRHGLAVGAVGASRAFADVARRAGLRRIYLGDEAILEAGPMNLSGGAMKSLRKAVNRVARHGFRAELHAVGELSPAAVAELEAVSGRWRQGADERGFSMAHDVLCDDLLRDASVVLARDAEGRVRGFLHFVPVFGRRAVSLAFMRRDHDTPNGLSDFLVVEAARLLGERGVEELSLNFAVFGRWLREPANALERAAGRVVRAGDRWFQLERLMRFNAKFHPRWQPRDLLFGSPAQLPRVVLGTLWAEGHLPEPRPWRAPQVTAFGRRRAHHHTARGARSAAAPAPGPG